jgi:hypothetical protein
MFKKHLEDNIMFPLQWKISISTFVVIPKFLAKVFESFSDFLEQHYPATYVNATHCGFLGTDQFEVSLIGSLKIYI